MLVEGVLSVDKLSYFVAVLAGAGVVEADKADFGMLMQVVDGMVKVGKIADVAYVPIVIFVRDESTAGQLPVTVEVDSEVVWSTEAVGRAGQNFGGEVLVDFLQGMAGIGLG